MRGAPVRVLWAEGVGLPMWSHAIWDTFDGLLLTTGRPPRRGVVPKGWHRVGCVLPHAALGGVTNLKSSVTAFTRSKDPPFSFGEIKGVDAPAITILDLRTSTRGARPALPPDAADGFDPRRDKLEWLALADQRRLTLPSSFSKTGWVTRPIATHEALRAADLPHGVADHLTAGERQALVSALSLPFKVVAHVANCVADWARGFEAPQPGPQGARCLGVKQLELQAKGEPLNEGPRSSLNHAPTSVTEGPARTLGASDCEAVRMDESGVSVPRLSCRAGLAQLKMDQTSCYQSPPTTPRTSNCSGSRGTGPDRVLLARLALENFNLPPPTGEPGIAHVARLNQKLPMAMGEPPWASNAERFPVDEHLVAGGEPGLEDDAGAVTLALVEGPAPGAREGNREDDQPPDADKTFKLAKEDGAEIPYLLWDERVARVLGLPGAKDISNALQCGLDAMRRLAHRWWVGLARSSWWAFWRAHRDSIKRTEPQYWKEIGMSGMKAVSYAAQSNFWEWSNGSALMFWRWPEEYQRDVAIGSPPHWVAEPPSKLTRQGRLGDATEKRLLLAKIEKLERRGYLVAGRPTSNLSYFAVAKGPTDIRAVFDATKSDLNSALTSPWFGLPQVSNMTRCLMPGYFCADNDVGEQFYNFPLHPALQKYCGIDVSPLRSGAPTSLIWTRLVMGFKPSPHQAVRDNRRAKYWVLGRHDDPTNVFGWDRVDLNYPGSPGYRPSHPWIGKKRGDAYACDVQDYVDDNRTTGPDYESTWRASTNLAKGYSHLGIQDAARKWCPPSQRPGPWAGAIIRTDRGSVKQSVTVERWIKTKVIIKSLSDELHNWGARPIEVGGLDHKTLERQRGFLIYVARAYTPLRPYLKGLHQTIDSWRPDQIDGWRNEALWLQWKEEHEELTLGDLKPPTKVIPVSHLAGDLKALRALTACEDPPELPVRPSAVAITRYGFRDASGDGFGVSVWDPNNGLEATQGLWTHEASAGSSNFRELLNLVPSIEVMAEEGTLTEGVELFLFTDNFVAETVFHRGDARSQPLFNAILLLRKLEMNMGLFVHIVWVSEKRMIAQGTDGLSRGDLTTGVMTGEAMLNFVPLHLSAATRSPALVPFLTRECFPLEAGGVWMYLAEDSWYTRPFHEDGFFVWTPAPCVADVAVSLMAESHHIRPWNGHLFIVPSLMTNRWRKQLSKASDLLMTLPFDPVLWDERSQFKRLTLAVVCPLLSSPPWRVGHSSLRGRVAHDVSGMQEPSVALVGNRVREFWMEARSLGFMPGSVARSLLRSLLGDIASGPPG